MGFSTERPRLSKKPGRSGWKSTISSICFRTTWKLSKPNVVLLERQPGFQKFQLEPDGPKFVPAEKLHVFVSHSIGRRLQNSFQIGFVFRLFRHNAP